MTMKAKKLAEIFQWTLREITPSEASAYIAGEGADDNKLAALDALCSAVIDEADAANARAVAARRLFSGTMTDMGKRKLPRNLRDVLKNTTDID